MEREELEKTLTALDNSIFFIVVIVASVLLSWLSLRKQREDTREALETGDTAQDPSIFPIRLGSSALIIGALGFFFTMSVQRHKQACQRTDPVEKRSAYINAASATLVLAASLLRLDDLLFTRQSRQSTLTEPELQPPV